MFAFFSFLENGFDLFDEVIRFEIFLHFCVYFLLDSSHYLFIWWCSLHWLYFCTLYRVIMVGEFHHLGRHILIIIQQLLKHQQRSRISLRQCIIFITLLTWNNLIQLVIQLNHFLKNILRNHWTELIRRVKCEMSSCSVRVIQWDDEIGYLGVNEFNLLANLFDIK